MDLLNNKSLFLRDGNYIIDTSLLRVLSCHLVLPEQLFLHIK